MVANKDLSITIFKVQNATLSKTTPKHAVKLVRQSTGETMPNAESTVHQDQPMISHMVIPKKLVKAHELLLLKAKLLKVKFLKVHHRWQKTSLLLIDRAL